VEPKRALSIGELARFFLAALFLGPLLGTVLFAFGSMIIEDNQISVAILFSPTIVYFAAFFFPCALLASVLMLWFRRNRNLNFPVVLLSGFLGGSIPALLAGLFVAEPIGGLSISLITGVVGMVIAALLWSLRGVFGLANL